MKQWSLMSIILFVALNTQSNANQLTIDDCPHREAPDKKAPNWVCEPKFEGMAIAAVGFSKKLPISSMTSASARADADVQLAKTFSNEILENFTVFQKSVSLDGVTKYEDNAELVRQTLVSTRLVGVKTIRSLTGPKQGYYVALGLANDAYKRNIEIALNQAVSKKTMEDFIKSMDLE